MKDGLECKLCGDELEPTVDPRNPSGVFCSHGIFCSQECSELFHEQEIDGIEVREKPDVH